MKILAAGLIGFAIGVGSFAIPLYFTFGTLM